MLYTYLSSWVDWTEYCFVYFVLCIWIMIAVPVDMLVSVVLKGAARSGIEVEGLADRSLVVAGYRCY